MTTFSLYYCNPAEYAKCLYYLVSMDGTAYRRSMSIKGAFSTTISRRDVTHSLTTVLATNFSTYEQLVREYPELFI